MTNEFCPRCNTLTDMNISEIERDEKTEEEEIYKIVTTSFHCNKCNTFVRSEDKKVSVG